jgi:hypothetical protein
MHDARSTVFVVRIGVRVHCELKDSISLCSHTKSKERSLNLLFSRIYKLVSLSLSLSLSLYRAFHVKEAG